MTTQQKSRGVEWRSPIFGGFCEDRQGAASGEFAIILPFALVLLTGLITYGDAIALDRKVTLTARTVTDLVTQYQTISKADLQTLLDGASSAIVQPYSSSPLEVTVSQVVVNAAGQAKIIWTQSTTNGAAAVHNAGDTITLPTQISSVGASYIWGQVAYTYTPSIGYQVTGPLILTDQTYMAPRQVQQIPTPQ